MESVQGRGRIDDCTVNVVVNHAQQYAAVVTGCDQLLMSRTQIVGSTLFKLGIGGQNGSALHVSSSHVTLDGCTLAGAKGFSPSKEGEDGGNGGNGVVIDGNSHVVIAGCPEIIGGEEGWGTEVFVASTDGQAGNGLVVSDSEVVVRGTQPDGLFAGVYDPSFGGAPGKAIIATSASSVVVSGVNLGSALSLSGGSVVLQPSVAEPYLTSVGGDVPARSTKCGCMAPRVFRR